MKLFLDSADVSEIITRTSTGLIDGITTNPTLIMKSGRKPLEVYKELISAGINDISMEVIGDMTQMLNQALNLVVAFGKNATIKVPCTPGGLAVCRELRSRGIRVNVTLIFNVAQAILAAKADATYVSPFVGRLVDNNISGIAVVKQIADVYKKHDVKTQVLAASIRDVTSVTEAFSNGADICTIPPKVFDDMYRHVLTEKGLYIFEKDAKAYNESDREPAEEGL